MKARLKTLLALFTLALLANASFAAFDMTFSGPNYTPPNYGGQPLDGGALRLVSGTGNSISATFTRGGTESYPFADNLVLFIDSKPGGFGSSLNFSGSGNLGSAAAGASTIGRSLAVFNAPAGTSFGADYVLAVGVNNGGAVFSIGSDGALTMAQSFSISPNYSQTLRNYNFSFDWSSIGVTDPSAGGFRFYSSYVNNTGARRFDSMESITGKAGFGNTITFDNYNVFGIDPVPEPTNIALAVFGGLVATGGIVGKVRRKMLKP